MNSTNSPLLEPEFEVKTAVFAKAAIELSQVPQDDLAQVAFLGRSNVGKSSLLSALMGKKKLVKISGTPGKTRELNFFLVNDAFYLVDLPGIGFAKVSIAQRDAMAKRIRDFVEKSRNLRGVVYLVDCRHEATKLDVETVETLRGLCKPVLIVASKSDKLGSSTLQSSLRTIQRKLDLPELPLAVSSAKGKGIAELWQELLPALAAPTIAAAATPTTSSTPIGDAHGH